MCRLCTASLFCVAGSVTSARVPPSLPVPAVVGTCTSATDRPATSSGPTTSASVCALPASTATSFARSMALPPPKPITTSGQACEAAANAASSVATSGSNATSPNTLTSPVRPSTSTREALNGSAITSARRPPTKRPTAATVPDPNSRACGRVISIGSSRVGVSSSVVITRPQA